MQLWILLSLISGLGDAVMYAAMKKLDSVSDSLVIWVQFAFALPFLAFLLLFNYPTNIYPQVYLIALINGVLFAVTTYLLLQATRLSSLSTAMPLLSLTPLFLIMTSYIMVREVPSYIGFIGIFLIVLGAYIIHLKPTKSGIKIGILAPFKALVTNKGSLYVLIVAFVYSILANLFKIGISESNPVFYSALLYAIVTIGMLPFMLYTYRRTIADIKLEFGLLILLGAASAVMMVTASYSMLSAIVPYAVSIKRSSVIFAVFLGYYLFKERNIKQALLGSIVMFIGGLFITLS